MRQSAGSTTIRINRTTHEVLKGIASEQDVSMQTVIESAIEKYRQHIMLSQMNEDFAALRKDKKAWKEELEERRLWDNTLGDGIEKD